MVDVAAFTLWGLTSRSPARLAADLGSTLHRPALVLRGLLRFITGVLLLLAGAVLLLPLTLETRTFTVLETWTVLTGLLVEALLGFRSRAV